MRQTKATRVAPAISFGAGAQAAPRTQATHTQVTELDRTTPGADYDVFQPSKAGVTRQIEVPHQHFAQHHYHDLAQNKANQSRRRSPRIDVTGSSCRVFVGFPELNSVRFPVVTLGYLGARFVTEGKPVSSLMGYDLQARLHLGPFNQDIKARLVTVDQMGAALEFLDPPNQCRDLIRDLFNLELTAATLAPFHNFSTHQGASVQTTIYSDESGNQFEIVVSTLGLEAIRGKLGHLEIKFAWARNQPRDLRISSLTGEAQTGLQFKDKLISAIKNLQGLPPQLKYEAELGLSAAK